MTRSPLLTMELKLAFIGYGNVARSFSRILDSRGESLAREYGLSCRTVAISTARHGSVISDDGIDPVEAAAAVEAGVSLSSIEGVRAASDPHEVIEECGADILFETTTLNPVDGEPAATYIRETLERGMHVVTANKGPVAFAYREIMSIARQNRVCFRFEGTVMDGAPVFNLYEYCLPGISVRGFAGVLNSTTNLIIDGMGRGLSFEDALFEAQRIGVAEANADYDVEGWDASVKAVVLANVLMGAEIHPADVAREGIRGIIGVDVRAARERGMAIRLVARGLKDGDRVKLSVKAERIPVDSLLGSTRGTTNALILQTDLMGEIAIVETDPGVEQTAYALLSDMLAVRRFIGEAKD